MKRMLSISIQAVMLLGFLSVYASYKPVLAETFVVTNTNDSGPGSLRQAILDANSNFDADVINFSIGTGVQTISPLSPLPTITSRVIIDGTTQPGYAGKPIIEIDGSQAGTRPGIQIFAGFSTIRGLVINRFNSTAILMTDTNGNTIEDNYIGTDVTGSIALGNAGTGVAVAIGTAFHVIRRNVISGNGGDGISLGVGLFNFVEDNFIGTDATGTLALGNTMHGIRASFQTIMAFRNVISGNGQNGIQSGGLNLFQGNFIGTDVSGTLPIGNFGHGIRANLDEVGGLNDGEGNTIAFNGGDGIFAPLSPSMILSNSIFANGGLGIDMEGDGVSANDPCDDDSIFLGPQNHPVLTSAIRTNTNTVIAGTLDSTPNSTFIIQFFSNAACDPSGFGEGQRFIGSITVTSGAGCITSFVATFPNTSVTGSFITATATNSIESRTIDSTSEFSQCLAIMNPNPGQAIQALIGNIESLVAQGVLNHGQGNALTSKLRAALQQLERGNTRAAANQINAFINQVDALVRSRRLSPQQGQALIDAAMNILGQIAP
ncbi:MAG TPA: right-handed parallel beta-helix repeat-containing protein [Blastocatellia bacterium]|nr:right-handed parallel beta-helix repeat-containing protein [Blastocatellia bacterium]